MFVYTEKLVKPCLRGSHQYVGTTFLSMDHFFLSSSRIYWHIWLQLFLDIKQMAWIMEREVRLDYLFIRSYIWKSTIRGGLHSEKYSKWLISKASQTNNLLNIMYQFFHNHRHFHEK